MITKNEVSKLAELARLKFDDAEVEQLQQDLAEVLQYVETLKEVDTAGIEPRLRFTGQENVFREDIVTHSLAIEEALANAPERVDDFLKVPKVVDN